MYFHSRRRKGSPRKWSPWWWLMTTASSFVRIDAELVQRLQRLGRSFEEVPAVDQEAVPAEAARCKRVSGADEVEVEVGSRRPTVRAYCSAERL